MGVNSSLHLMTVSQGNMASQARSSGERRISRLADAKEFAERPRAAPSRVVAVDGTRDKPTSSASTSAAPTAAARNTHQLLKSNRLIIAVTNVCCSLEWPLGRPSLRPELSTSLAWLRLGLLTWILVRMILFWIFQSCDYATLRACLLDWTTLYPESRRVGLIKSFICLSLCLLGFRWSILVGRLRRRCRLDTTLIDYLCRPPPARSNTTWRPLHGSQVDGEEGEAEGSDDDDDDDYDEGDSDSLFDKRLTEYLKRSESLDGNRWPGEQSPYLRRTGGSSPLLNLSTSRREHRHGSQAGEMSSPSTSITMASGSSRATRRVLLRNRAHWFYVSRGLRQAAITTFYYIVPLSVVIFAASLRRLLLVHKITRQCDLINSDPLIRAVGGLELLYSLVEGLFTLYGLTVQTRLVSLDICHQVDAIERELLVAEELKVQQLPSVNQGQLNNVFTINHQPSTNKRRASRAVAVNNHRLVSASEKSLLGQRQLSSNWSLSPSADYLGDLWAKTASFSARDQLWFRSLVAQSAYRTALLGDPIDRDEKEVPVIQTKVIQMLCCIDSHRPLIAFLGSPLHIWMITSLSFVPLIKFKSNMTREDLLGTFIYIYLLMSAVVALIRFLYVCANVNQRALRLPSIIFRICTNCRERSVVRRWNKIFMIWYCPNRCAFQIGGIVDLTYVNILKTVSFLLSGITLMLSYSSD